jgi:hypothetical protein
MRDDWSDEVKRDWEKVKSYNLHDLVRLYAHKFNHPYSYVAEAAEECRKYLFLTKHATKYAKIGLASNVIDYFWHYWIICTPEYEDFCENYLGKRVSHNPARYWAETFFNKVEFPEPMHHMALIEYEKLYGYKAPNYLWTGLDSKYTANPVMPGCVSWNAPIMTLEGNKFAHDIRIGDEIIGTDSSIVTVKGISSWGSQNTQDYLKFPNYDWFYSDNCPLHAGQSLHSNSKIICMNPDKYNESIKTPVEVSLSDEETATLEIDETVAIKNLEKYHGSGIEKHYPDSGTEVYTFYTNNGFRVAGGINILTPVF